MAQKKRNRRTSKVQKNLFMKYLIAIIKIPYFLIYGMFLFLRFIFRGVWSLGRAIHRFSGFSAKKIEEMKDKKHEKDIISLRDKLSARHEKFEIIETLAGDFGKWEESATLSESKIGIIIGARGTGKSAIGIKLLENAYSYSGKTCYAIGFNKEDMPSWINVVEDISEIRNNALVLIDEGGVLFSARDSMSKANKMLSDLILISRHKSLSIIFISQNSANLDIDILRQADYLILKPSSLLQLDFERKKIKDVYSEVMPTFEKYKATRGITYIYSDLFRGFISNPLPSFWSTDISKSFK